MNLQFALRAGLTLGLLRSAWIAVEHFTGIRTTHLELVEPSYGLYLFLGGPLAWLYLLRSNRFNRPSLSLKGLLPAAVGAGAVAGAVNVLTFVLYTELLNPAYLDAFIQWNVSKSSNTYEIANREFRLPAFLDILVMHPLLLNPATAALVLVAVRHREKWHNIRTFKETAHDMNRFPVLTLTAATLFLGASAFGQFPTLPYNPDDNADGLIGVADLQGLLSQYGNEFSASVLSSDVALARIDQDGLGLLDCLSNCNALPGPWQMLTTEVAALNINAVAELVPISSQYSAGAQNYFWTEDNGTSGNATKYYTVEGIRTFSTVSSMSYTPRACLCYAQGRPHIEYDFCYLEALPGDDSEFRACLDSKASEGWYPLGGVAQDYGRMYQAFWRWEQ